MKFAALLFAAALFVTSAFAVVPTTMTYQAIFTDLEGNVMPDGVYEIGFHIFPAPVGGPPVWSEWQDVTVTDGVFEVILGTINPLAPTDFLDPAGDGQWMSLSYNDTWMNPRQFISSVPYAFLACWADSARTAGSLGVYTEDVVDSLVEIYDERLDDAEACLDTVKSQIDSVRDGLIGGGFGLGGGVFGQNANGDIVGETEMSFDSDDFAVLVPSGIVYFAQIINDGLDHQSWKASVSLHESDGTLIDETGYSFQATARTDMHVQKAVDNISDGTYFLRVTIQAVGGQVDVDDIEFGAMWIPSLPVAGR